MLLKHETPGTALRDGVPVASVTVVETVEQQAIPVPIPGTGQIGYKPRITTRPSSIVFEEIADDGFANELRRLAEAVGDVDRMRRQRDTSSGHVAFALRLADGRVAAASVRWPAFGLGALERIEFPLSANL